MPLSVKLVDDVQAVECVIFMCTVEPAGVVPEETFSMYVVVHDPLLLGGAPEVQESGPDPEVNVCDEPVPDLLLSETTFTHQPLLDTVPDFVKVVVHEVEPV